MIAGRWGAPLALALALAPASPTPARAAGDACAIVRVDDVAAIVGFALQGPDDASRASGICYYPARSVTDEGSAGFAIVTAADLERRRPYFGVLARRCAGTGLPAAAAACAGYAALARAKDVDAYFKARTGEGAIPLPRLGSAAFATPAGVFVRRGARVIEAVVTLGESLDVERATALAALVLARIEPEPGAERSAPP